MVQHIQPPDGAGDKQKRQQQRAAHERGDSYNDAHKNACAVPDGIVRELLADNQLDDSRIAQGAAAFRWPCGMRIDSWFTPFCQRQEISI